jgi:uncharacterized protein YjaZ
MIKNIILCIFCSFVIQSVSAQNLITSDLENFKYTFDNLQDAKNLKDTIDLIQQNVIDKASPTFKEYLDLKEQGGQNVINEYVRCLKNYPKYYRSVLEQSEIFKNKTQIKKIESAYKRLMKFYPNAKLKPNVICIGIMDDGGKSFKSGQYIGLEVFACNEKANKSELDDFKKDYLGGGSFDLKKIDEVITHELVHLSQFKGDENFAKTFKGTIKFIPLLSEGGASFVTDYIYNYKATIGPGVFYQEQLDYCNKNKSQLWLDYLHEDEFNKFFWAINPKYPVQRIGYYLGYQVCKSYLDKSKNKMQAIKDIIEVTDWDNFVLKSGFGL